MVPSPLDPHHVDRFPTQEPPVKSGWDPCSGTAPTPTLSGFLSFAYRSPLLSCTLLPSRPVCNLTSLLPGQRDTCSKRFPSSCWPFLETSTTWISERFRAVHLRAWHNQALRSLAHLLLSRPWGQSLRAGGLSEDANAVLQAMRPSTLPFPLNQVPQ